MSKATAWLIAARRREMARRRRRPRRDPTSRSVSAAREAAAVGTIPPADWTTNSWRPGAPRSIASRQPARYSRALESRTATFSAVAAARSYSRASALTSWDRETLRRPRAASPTRRSCVGVGVGVQQAHGHRLDAGLAATHAAQRMPAARSSSSVVPSRRERSARRARTSARGGTIAARRAGRPGRRDRHATVAPMRRTSAKPRVVTSAVRAKCPRGSRS